MPDTTWSDHVSCDIAIGVIGVIITETRPSEEHAINSKKLLNKLKADGWEEVRVRGSHHHLKHPTKPGTITVPHPKKDLPAGTVNQILKSAGLK